MTEMLIKASLALAAGLSTLSTVSLAADPSSDSPYRLSVHQKEYRVRTDSRYQLEAEYQKPKPKPDPQVQNERPARRPLPAELAAKPYARDILLAAAAASIDPALVHAVIHVESGYRQQAISPKGAIGLMQVMPGTAERYGVSAARLNPKRNLDVGTRYLRDLMHMFNDRLDLVLAAYNAGEGAVRRYSDKIPPYPETQSYVRAVMARYAELGGSIPARAATKSAARK